MGFGTSFSKRGKEKEKRRIGEKKNRGKEEEKKMRKEEKKKKGKEEMWKKEKRKKGNITICLVGIESPEPLPKWRSCSQVGRDSPNNRSPFFRSITIQCIRGV